MPRPRFQFRLRTLFVVVTVVAIVCWYVAGEWRIVRERKAVFDQPTVVEFNRGTPKSEWAVRRGGPGWVRRLLGDDSVATVIINDDGTMAADDYERLHEQAARLFPEADIIPSLSWWRHATRPARVTQLIIRIDDNPDLLHADYTPEVNDLIKVGPDALEPLLALMLTDSEETRMHADRAIEGIAMEMMGFRFGRGWDDDDGEGRFREFWKSLGSLRWDESLYERQKSVAKWREWIDQRESKDQGGPDRP